MKTKREFETLAKRAYALDLLQHEWNIDDTIEVEKTFEEIQDRFDHYYKYETKYNLYYNNEPILSNQYYEDPYFYITAFILGEIKAKVEIKWNDIEDFEEWYKG